MCADKFPPCRPRNWWFLATRRRKNKNFIQNQNKSTKEFLLSPKMKIYVAIFLNCLTIITPRLLWYVFCLFYLVLAWKGKVLSRRVQSYAAHQAVNKMLYGSEKFALVLELMEPWQKPQNFGVNGKLPRYNFLRLENSETFRHETASTKHFGLKRRLFISTLLFYGF
jgi:hypothetical protein